MFSREFFIYSAAYSPMLGAGFAAFGSACADLIHLFTSQVS